MQKSTQITIIIEYQKKVCMYTMYLFISSFNRFCFRTGKNYYPQVFLEECIYVLKEKKIPEYITDDIKISSDDSDREDSE